MNCDEFLEAVTSGDEGRMTAAQWHAKSCPACAALAEVHSRLKKELGAKEPLPQRMRAVWATALEDVPSRSPSDLTLARRASEGRAASHLPMQIVSVAAALLALFTVGVLMWQPPKLKDVVEGPKVKIETSPTVIVKVIDASAELTDLLAQVNALEAELSKTSKEAELVDARREANVLLATYSNW